MGNGSGKNVESLMKISMKAEIEEVENGYVVYILKDHKRYVALDLKGVLVVLARERGESSGGK